MNALCQLRLLSRCLQIGGVAAVFLCLSVAAQETDDLKDIRQKIEQSQQRIKQQMAEAERLQARLRKAELEIASTARALNQTQIALENNNARQRQLETQQTDIRAQLAQQRSALAKQLKSAYMAGHYDYLKMLFNQQDAGKFERVLSYYQYANKARQSQIDSFRSLIDELQTVVRQLAEQQAELATLEQQQSAQREQLAQRQAQRKETLALLESSIQSEAAKVEQLQLNERSLLKAIEDAQRRQQQSEVALNGLSALKGMLPQPTQGRFRKLFGNRRQGQVRWKGVLINGNAGNPVRAIHDGKVLYADWLRGFGLVTVIDHGQGYMSLYGHNQALLRQAGDTVRGGDTIALVGQSGGQSSPNLYFEIRYKGQAINPSDWLKL